MFQILIRIYHVEKEDEARNQLFFQHKNDTIIWCDNGIWPSFF